MGLPRPVSRLAGNKSPILASDILSKALALCFLTSIHRPDLKVLSRTARLEARARLPLQPVTETAQCCAIDPGTPYLRFRAGISPPWLPSSPGPPQRLEHGERTFTHPQHYLQSGLRGGEDETHRANLPEKARGTQCLAAVSRLLGDPRQKKPGILKWRNLCLAEEIFILKNDGQLEPVREQKFDLEDVLRPLVADHPELLSGQQIDPDNPRRWLLADREQGISDIVGGGNRRALDHLLIDQHAIPTLLEVKRSENSEIRRTIAGQMLDYAAHARHTWSASEIRRVFEERTGPPPCTETSTIFELWLGGLGRPE